MGPAYSPVYTTRHIMYPLPFFSIIFIKYRGRLSKLVALQPGHQYYLFCAFFKRIERMPVIERQISQTLPPMTVQIILPEVVVCIPTGTTVVPAAQIQQRVVD